MGRIHRDSESLFLAESNGVSRCTMYDEPVSSSPLHYPVVSIRAQISSEIKQWTDQQANPAYVYARRCQGGNTDRQTDRQTDRLRVSDRTWVSRNHSQSGNLSTLPLTLRAETDSRLHKDRRPACIVLCFLS